jgi:type II secretory pathway component PulM
MSRFQSLSGWTPRLNSRERRVVAGGALVAGLALLATWVVLPLAGRWEAREDAIAAREGQVAQVQGLVEGESAIRRYLAERQQERATLRNQLLTGTTPALAAASLQALLQRYANASRVTLERVDLVAEPASGEARGLVPVPVELSATGDVYGLADLLGRLQYSYKLLVIDELQVSAGATDNRGSPLLTWSVRLHGAYSPD